VKQWDRFEHVPGGILAHGTHVTRARVRMRAASKRRVFR
jgi:hypothetical protein